jgi:hypothetical protein
MTIEHRDQAPAGAALSDEEIEHQTLAALVGSANPRTGHVYIDGNDACEAVAATILASDWLAARDAADAGQVADAVRALADERAARKIAGDSADRFRDVLSECLGYADENPGDDVLVHDLREHFDKTGPEPTRWRDFCSGALALVDQIAAMPDPAQAAALREAD